MKPKDLSTKLSAIKGACALLTRKLRLLFPLIPTKFQNETSVIGVDVGSATIKAVQLVHINGEWTLVKSSFVEMQPDITDDDQVAKDLSKALIGFDMAGAKVVALVNCPQTCTRRIITPNMPRHELAEAVRWEAKNAIPFSIDKAMMDYEVVGEVAEKGIKKLILTVAAAPQETVQRLVRIFTKAQVTLSALIPVSVGTQNIIRQSKDNSRLNVAVADIGATVTELNIYQKGQLAFSRKLPIAGGDFTKSLTSTLMTGEGKMELSYGEAEQIKRERGIPGEDDTETINGKILPNYVLALVRPCVEQLGNEMERSFDFYREESHGEKVDKIVLFGGGSNLKRLVEMIHVDLGVPVEVGDAMAGVRASGNLQYMVDNPGSRFNLALGAGLNHKGKINLLPAELKEKTRRFVTGVFIRSAAVAFAIMMVLVYLGVNIQLKSLHKKRAALEFEQKTLVPQLESVRSVMMADRILSGHPYWEDVLMEISNRIDPRIYLTELQMTDDKVRLKGIIMKGNREADMTLSGFMIALENGIFRHVSLVTSKKDIENANLSEFEIQAEVE